MFADRAAVTNSAAAGRVHNQPVFGTRAVEDAGDELAYGRTVNQGNRPTRAHQRPRAARVARRSRESPTGTARPVPDITVRIAREDVTDTTVTDAAGDFRVESRGPGTYRVSVNVPERFYSDDAEAIVTLRDPRSCAAVEAMLHDNGQVAGRIVDAAGRPVAGLTIELVPSGKGPGTRILTARDGRYSLARLPPGRFVLSIPAGPSKSATLPGSWR